MSSSEAVPLRFGELLGRLSLAFDIANDATPGSTVRSTVLAVELGRRAGASSEELRESYWETLLGGRAGAGLAVPTGPLPAIAVALHRAYGTLRRFAPKASRTRRLGAVCRTLEGSEVEAPGPHESEALGEAMRLRETATLVESLHRKKGRAVALEMCAREALIDPRHASVLSAEHGALFDTIEDPRIFERFLELEPMSAAGAHEFPVDDIAHAVAIMIELETPVFLGHSAGVAALAERAAGQWGLCADELQTLRLAALLHDVGRASVPNAVWMRQGPLDWCAWERIRLTPYYTERILSPIVSLAGVAAIASAAHERVDGSGFPQRRSARALPPAARVLAVADMARAMSEPRAHRPAASSSVIARELVAKAKAGRLDAKAVDAVLACLGVSERTAPSVSRGLSERELDVSRLLARGKSDKEIGATLRISPRTVQVHVGRILEKLGVRSRAGAAVWLIEHDMAH